MANLNLPEVKDRDPNVEVDLEVLNDTIEYIRPAVQADGGDIKFKSFIFTWHSELSFETI